MIDFIPIKLLTWAGKFGVASYIAYLNHRSKPILEGRICVILTRHLSKCALRKRGLRRLFDTIFAAWPL